MTAGKLLKAYTFPHQPTSLSFSPMEFILSVTTSAGGIYLYDLSNFDCISSLEASGQPILAGDFDPSGDAFFAAYQDRLETFTWEPLAKQETVSVKWGNVRDFFVFPSEKKFVAASVEQNYLSFWGLNLKTSKKAADSRPSSEALKLPKIPSVTQLEKGTSDLSLTSIKSSKSAEFNEKIIDKINLDSPYLKEKKKGGMSN
jgi:hypothetical protein